MTLIQPIDTKGCGCDAQDPHSPLITIDQALHCIACNVTAVEEIDAVPLLQATGRILAAPVTASTLAPPFDNAAMDGYAIDTSALIGPGPWALPVIGRVPAGSVGAVDINGKSAARIFTGAPVPPGADAVVAQEYAHRTGDRVTFDRRPAVGLNIRKAGGDFLPGEIVVAAGARLGPREIAAAAATGADTVQVRRRLRVSLLVTGEEVREAGSQCSKAEIWDVNTPMLCAALASPDIELIRVRHGADNREDLQCTLADMAAIADLVVTTGGISVGDEDHVKPALARLGARIHFSGVAIKPGKPIAFGHLGQAAWLGLPGNPLSALVTWQVFGRSVLDRLLGGRCTTRRRHVVTDRPIVRKPGRCELRPARIVGFDATGHEIVAFDDAVQSGHVGNLPGADGLVILPSYADFLPEGASIEFQPF